MAMNKFTIIDVEKWKRKEHYHFFKTFDEPYFGVTCMVDVKKAYQNAKDRNTSFFIYYLHKSLCAINELSAFKIRIENDVVLEFDDIHASATVSRDDGTFGFSFIIFDADYTVFEQNALQEIQRIRNSTNLFPERNGHDVVHFSSLPWLNFTALSHARNYNQSDSVPKLSVGQVQSHLEAMQMPCSVHVHHGLADGKDVGDFFGLFQDLLNQP
jgi:chloramphenicol O-acetyltransferase type A